MGFIGWRHGMPRVIGVELACFWGVLKGFGAGDVGGWGGLLVYVRYCRRISGAGDGFLWFVAVLGAVFVRCVDIGKEARGVIKALEDPLPEALCRMVVF